MDISVLDFECQKALHLALRLARASGHSEVEIEHVALVMLSSCSLRMDQNTIHIYKSALESHLNQIFKHFGITKLSFGKRLLISLEDCLSLKTDSEKIPADLFFKILTKHSTLLKNTESKTDINNEPQFELENFEKIKNNSKKPTSSHPNDKNEQEKKGFKPGESLLLYTRDLSELAEKGEIDPVIGRDKELRRLLEVLGRKKKNNPVLVGEAGVGKTAIAEALALRISQGRVPQSFLNKRVLVLDLSLMIAGAKYRGEFEARLTTFLKELRDLSEHIVLFVDEIHMLVGAGGAEGTADAANIMKPALARGDFQCVGATTFDEYAKHIEKDPALERRFQKIHVEEPSETATLAILRGLKSKYEVFHRVRISDDALKAAVELSRKYLPARRLPDKAIDLIDEAASRLAIQTHNRPRELEELHSVMETTEIELQAIDPGGRSKNKEVIDLRDRLEQAKREFEAIHKQWETQTQALDLISKLETEKLELEDLLSKAKKDGDLSFAATLQNDRLPKAGVELDKKRANLARLLKENAFLKREVGRHEIVEVMSQMVGMTIDWSNESKKSDLSKIKDELKKEITGQSQAVDVLANAVRRCSLGLSDSSRTLGVFLFVGPTGVGKTHSAASLARVLFGDIKKMVKLDMSEFMEEHSVSKLIGAPPGYTGFESGGFLTEAAQRLQHGVIVFDEIEKAHPRILDALLQVFDEGRLTDGKGRTADLRNFYMIMTSNLPVYSNPLLKQAIADGQIRRQLRDFMRPELINRIDEIVIFHELSENHHHQIIDHLLADLNERLVPNRLELAIGETLRDKISKQIGPAGGGGRGLRRIFERLVIQPVTDWLLDQNLEDKEVSQKMILDYEGEDGIVWRTAEIDSKSA